MWKLLLSKYSQSKINPVPFKWAIDSFIWTCEHRDSFLCFRGWSQTFARECSYLLPVRVINERCNDKEKMHLEKPAPILSCIFPYGEEIGTIKRTPHSARGLKFTTVVTKWDFHANFKGGLIEIWAAEKEWCRLETDDLRASGPSVFVGQRIVDNSEKNGNEVDQFVKQGLASGTCVEFNFSK